MLEKKTINTHIKETISLAIPVVIGQLGQVLMGVQDTAMIGKLGYQYVSAAALANGIYFVALVFGIGIMSAMSPLIAEAAAKNDTEQCRNYFQSGVVTALVWGVLIGAVVFMAAPLLHYMDQPVEDVRLAYSFLRISALGTPAILLFLATKQFADGLSDTIPAMIITFIGLACNFVLNTALIEGKFGFPRLELDGAAIATILSRCLMLLCMLLYLGQKKYASYQLFHKGKNWKSSFFSIQKLGIPSGLQYVFEVASFAGVAIMIGWIGQRERSAHQIALSIASITYMVAAGISSAAAIRVGDAFGRKDVHGNTEIRKAGFAALYIVLVFMGFTAILFIVGRDFLPTLYQIEDAQTLEICTRLMVISAIFQLFDGLQVVALGALRGIQDTTFPTVVTFVAYGLISLCCSYLLGFTWKMGVDGTWYAFIIALLLAGSLNFARFHFLTREK